MWEISLLGRTYSLMVLTDSTGGVTSPIEKVECNPASSSRCFRQMLQEMILA